jgi:hypothetical protein
MDKPENTKFIFLMKPDEREQLDRLSEILMRSRSNVVRVLIRQEYDRLQALDQTPTDQTK